jgi:hypothetical protein
VDIVAPDGEYGIHQFKNYIGVSASVTLRWEGQSSQAPLISPGVLQIYNHDSGSWETVATNSTAEADTDFVLSRGIDDTTNYVTDSVITCRVYQLG